MLGKARLIASSLASCAAVTAAILCFVALVPLAGCEQGEGQRCQTSDDCESGLVCPASTGVCQPSNLANDGGLPPPDANGTGPQPADAAVDAAVDAAPLPEDATPLPDDAAVDAAPAAG
jgi:hypothetical protein